MGTMEENNVLKNILAFKSFIVFVMLSSASEELGLAYMVHFLSPWLEWGG